MLDDAATARLAEFFAQIRDMSYFMDCPVVDARTRGFQGETPLKVAVVQQNAQIVKDLLDDGADPNATGEDNQTPLHHAVRRKNLEIIRLLLDHGASSSVIDIYGKTPADKAVGAARELFTPNA